MAAPRLPFLYPPLFRRAHTGAVGAGVGAGFGAGLAGVSRASVGGRNDEPARGRSRDSARRTHTDSLADRDHGCADRAVGGGGRPHDCDQRARRRAWQATSRLASHGTCLVSRSHSADQDASSTRTRRPWSAQRRGLATNPAHRQAHVERHGKAVEVLPVEMTPVGGGGGVGAGATTTPSNAKPATAQIKMEKKDGAAEREACSEKGLGAKERSQGVQHTGSKESANGGGAMADGAESKAKGASTRTQAPSESSRTTSSSDPRALPDSKHGNPADQAPAQSMSTSPGPVETILHMPSPATTAESEAAKPLHLQTPPYVHHFDTYTLVRQVEAGGFTKEQSVTCMKAVRNLLAVNLGIAKEGLVGKSDVENETYLFRAACSELKTEIQNSRRARDEEMRRERNHLQQEMDILNQKLNQDLLSLKDELKGMFDDRKMSVREEQRDLSGQIQELHYKITVMLNSDAKSEVEGLRWVLTRRSVLGILIMAAMVLASLRYAKYRARLDATQLKKESDFEAASGASFDMALDASRGDAGGALSKEGAKGMVEVLAASVG